MDFGLSVWKDGISITNMGYDVGEKKYGGQKQKFAFGHKFEMLIRHLNREIQ